MPCSEDVFGVAHGADDGLAADDAERVLVRPVGARRRELTEMAPGIGLERGMLSPMGLGAAIAAQTRAMDAVTF